MQGQAAYVMIVADAFCHKSLPHLASPYKGEESARSLIPLPCHDFVP